MRRRLVTVTCLLAALAGSACSGVKVDGELMDTIRDAAAKCTLDMKYAFVRGPQEAVISDMILKKKGPVASLPTLSAALVDKDPKVRVVANRYLYREIKDNIADFAKDPKATPKAAVENLVKAIEQSKEYVTYYAVAAATMLATLHGLEDRLVAAVEKHPEPALRAEMVQFLVRYGRLRVFPRLVAYAESGEKHALPRVLDSLRNLYDWTEAEKKTVGDWALKHLDNADDETRIRVVYALYLAGGSWYDAALDRFEKEIKDKKVPRLFVTWLKNMGSSDSKEQKERRLALLAAAEKVLPAEKK